MWAQKIDRGTSLRKTNIMCALELVVQEEISDYLSTVPFPLFAVSKETLVQ